MPITPQELITNLGDLPPLPQVAAQVLRLSADPEATAGDFQRVIALDPALAGQVLRISNSTAFGMMREVTTLTQAITTLGVSALKSVVLASSARNLYRRGTVGSEERLLWEHALVTAMASRAFAERLGLPQTEEAFVGGLLHDIGKSVLGVKFPERYGPLLRTVYEQKAPASSWNGRPSVSITPWSARRWPASGTWPTASRPPCAGTTSPSARAGPSQADRRGGPGQSAGPGSEGRPGRSLRAWRRPPGRPWTSSSWRQEPWPASRRTSAPPSSGTRP